MVEGEVSRIGEAGAFIKFPSGIEGFIHISELSDERVNKIEDILNVGDKKTFRVVKVNQEDHKLGLSLRSEPTAEEKKAAAAKKEAARPSKKEETIRPKSQFQLELEKHAARMSGDETTTEEE